VLINGAVELTWIDSANVSNVGSLYRYCGFGIYRASGASPTVADFGFADNAPGALIGDFFRAYSTKSTAVALTNSLVAAVAPASFYDTTALQSSQYTYAASTNKLTVTKAGIYLVEVGTQFAPNASDTYVYFGTAVFKNGGVYKYSGQHYMNSPGAVPFYIVASGVFVVQLNAGDYIQPGFFAYASPTADKTNIIGDTSDESVIFTCALMNTGTAA
jgi:hypothetical protein